MEQITQWTQVTEEQLTYALARQLGSMELATQVARAGMAEITTIRSQAADKVVTTLATADQIVKAASYTGRVTPDKEAEVQAHTQQYLKEMLGIAHDAGGTILDVLLKG